MGPKSKQLYIYTYIGTVSQHSRHAHSNERKKCIYNTNSQLMMMMMVVIRSMGSTVKITFKREKTRKPKQTVK